MHWLPRALSATAGFALLGAGLAMLVLPGPGLLVLALGLAVLALEFAWAETLLQRSMKGGIRVGGILGSFRPHPRLLFVLAAAFLLLAAGATWGAIHFF